MIFPPDPLLMPLMHENKKKTHARQSHQESEASKHLLPENLKKRYKESSFLMAGQVF
jgi:hypothetical protein